MKKSILIGLVCMLFSVSMSAEPANASKEVKGNSITNMVNVDMMASQQTCTGCRGTGRVQCYPCRGDGRITCGGCNGKGYNPYSKSRTACSSCNGKGTQRCNVCGGRGSSTCSSCGGRGTR